MKNALTVLLSAFLLNACVSAPVVPTEHQLRSIERIRIVALESPPLEVPSRLVLRSTKFSQFPMVSAGPTSAFFVISGILMHVESPSAQWLGQESEGLTGLLSRKDLWNPTLVLAEETERQLAASGWPTAHSAVLQTIPGVEDLSFTYLGEPLRQWYNADVSPYDYSAHLVLSNETIVEVAIINYSVFLDDRLLLQLCIKVVDPVTGKILGRTSDLKNAPLNTEKAFADDGKIFKEVFSQSGRELISRCLAELHLKPHP